MRVLIVGCGYVGLPLGAELARQGHEVLGVRRSAASTDELRAANIRPVLADITQPAELAAIPGTFDWVVNCVSSNHGGAEEYRRLYLQGTKNLIAWLAESPPKKFVYTSSTSVYAQTDGSEVNEDSPAESETETGKILRQTEEVLLVASKRAEFPAVILRFAGIYGPGRGYWLRKFVEGTARIEGDGSRILNFIHRDDAVGAIIAALERGRPGEIYNVTDNEPVTQRQFLEWLAEHGPRLVGRVAPRAPEPEHSEQSKSSNQDTFRKRGTTSKRVLNEKLRTELGYQFRYPTFREGCTEELARMGTN